MKLLLEDMLGEISTEVSPFLPDISRDIFLASGASFSTDSSVAELSVLVGL